MDSQTIAMAAMDWAAKALVILLLAAVVTGTIPRASAAMRYMVWLLAMLGVLVMPLASSSLPPWRVLPALPRVIDIAVDSQAWVAGASRRDGMRAPASGSRHSDEPNPSHNNHFALTRSLQEIGPVVAAPVQALPNIAPPTHPAARPWGWFEVLTLVWTVGFVACLIPPVLGAWSLYRLRALCRSINEPAWTRLFFELCQEMGVNRSVQLLMSPARSMPMTWGILRPRLLIPAQAADWTPQRRRLVLLHELAHIKRHDCLIQWLTNLTRALHWFNPLIWYAAARMAAERERACDDMVLRGWLRAGGLRLRAPGHRLGTPHTPYGRPLIHRDGAAQQARRAIGGNPRPE